jgi:hypothetical protein
MNETDTRVGMRNLRHSSKGARLLASICNPINGRDKHDRFAGMGEEMDQILMKFSFSIDKQIKLKHNGIRQKRLNSTRKFLKGNF